MDIERAQQQVEHGTIEAGGHGESGSRRRRPGSAPHAGPDRRKSLQPIVLRPKKKDIIVQWSGLLWLPYWHLETGGAEPAFPIA